MPNATRYEDDVVAWAHQQARFCERVGSSCWIFTHLAEEIEDVGKREQRELDRRMAVLLSNLLKWQYQPQRRGASQELTIRNQRRGIARVLAETPGLRQRHAEPGWWAGVWDDATARAAVETGLAAFPETCPWSPAEVLREGCLPAP